MSVEFICEVILFLRTYTVTDSNKNHLASDPCNGGTVCLLRTYLYNIIHMCFALEKAKHAVTAISLCLHLTSEITVLVQKVIEIDLRHFQPLCFPNGHYTVHIKQPLVRMLHQLKPVHGLIPYLLTFFNIIIFYKFVFQRTILN